MPGTGTYRSRRGAEAVIFNATIVLAVIFFILAILNVIVVTTV